MLEETLEKLGLSEKEAAIYLAVLEQGKVSPAHAAKLTRINRTTVYSVAKELVKKGLIIEDLAGPSGFLVARQPQDLRGLIYLQEEKIKKQKELVEAAIHELENLGQKSKYPIPKITFIQEESLEEYLYKRSDEWHASIMKYDGILWGFQDHTFAEHYEKWIDWEWRIGGPKNLRLRLFSNESSVEQKNKQKEYSNRRIIKYWNKTLFTGTVWVHGDYLLLVQTRERPHYLVEIYDTLLAENMRQFFAGAWDEIK